MMTSGTSTVIDLWSEDVRVDPYPAYERIRQLGGAYFDPVSKSWFFSEFSDVDSILRNTKVFSSRPASVEASLNGADGLLHRNVRQIAQRAFSGQHLAALETRIAELATHTVGRLTARNTEFVSEVACVVPGAVLAWMIGESAASTEDYRRWVAAILRTSQMKKLSRPDYRVSPLQRLLSRVGLRRRAALSDDVRECLDFVKGHIDKCLKSEERGWFTDIVLSAYESEDISSVELADVVLLMIIAAYETTTSLLGLCAIFLARNPEYQRLLRDDPERLLPFIEEMLRYDSPVQRRPRVTLEPVEVAGVRLESGASIVALIGAANRDPAEFSEPWKVDLSRERNRHLAFGSGPHFCLGAQLARMEARYVLAALCRTGLELSLSAEQCIEHPANLAIRGPRRLDVIFS